MKSKKYVLYLYKDKAGGNICECDERGKIKDSSKHNFANKEQAREQFDRILDKW
jgi:hypothetical protein